MSISRITIKMFGVKNEIFRVLRAGQVVHVAESEKAAQEWIDAQG